MNASMCRELVRTPEQPAIGTEQNGCPHWLCVPCAADMLEDSHDLATALHIPAESTPALMAEMLHRMKAYKTASNHRNSLSSYTGRVVVPSKLRPKRS